MTKLLFTHWYLRIPVFAMFAMFAVFTVTTVVTAVFAVSAEVFSRDYSSSFRGVHSDYSKISFLSSYACKS